MNPKPRRAAIVAALPVLLVATGLLRGALELFASHPQTVRFSTEGRRTTGEVFESGGARRAGPSKTRSYAQIAADDPELGGQLIEVSGYPPVGKAVPLLCLAALRRCASPEEIAHDLARWPLTPGMMLAGVLLAAAALLQLVSSRRYRQPEQVTNER
jgi:hypothetical protein